MDGSTYSYGGPILSHATGKDDTAGHDSIDDRENSSARYHQYPVAYTQIRHLGFGKGGREGEEVSSNA